MVIWANLDKNITFWKPNILNRTFIAKKESMWRVFDGDSQTGVGGALSEYKISPISVPSIVCTYKYKYIFFQLKFLWWNLFGVVKHFYISWLGQVWVAEDHCQESFSASFDIFTFSTHIFFFSDSRFFGKNFLVSKSNAKRAESWDPPCFWALFNIFTFFFLLLFFCQNSIHMTIECWALPATKMEAKNHFLIKVQIFIAC